MNAIRAPTFAASSTVSCFRPNATMPASSNLIAFGQKPKKVTTYTPVTGVNMEEVFPVAAYMVKHYYKGDMDYLAWGDRHMRSYYIGYYWGLGRVLLSQPISDRTMR